MLSATSSRQPAVPRSIQVRTTPSGPAMSSMTSGLSLSSGIESKSNQLSYHVSFPPGSLGAHVAGWPGPGGRKVNQSRNGESALSQAPIVS